MSDTKDNIPVAKRDISRHLETKQLAPMASEGSPAAVNAEYEYQLILHAAERGDAEAALRLYEKAVVERGQLIDSLIKVLPLTKEAGAHLPFTPRDASPGTIAAMERIALSAIGLAKHVIDLDGTRKK